MMAFQFICCQGVLYIGTIIIKPYFFGRLSFAEKQHICFYALSIEDTCRQTQDSMQIEILQQAFTDCFACSGLKEDIVRKYHSCTTTCFEHKHHVLKEIQLVVLGLHIEIRTVDVHRAGRASSKRRIGEYHIDKG